MDNLIKGFGAHESEKDPRNIQHADISLAAAVPLIKGGVSYIPSDIHDQHQVGICTAIDRTQLREKQTGKQYSADFQYLLQKKYYDGNWDEGSSILNANKVAFKYGFLPILEWTHTIEDDRKLPYSQYIAKLQIVSDIEIQRLLGLCIDKIAGYAQVDVTDPQMIAQAIINSPQQAGIQCRFWVDSNWWTSVTGVVSWNSKDIDPLRAPAQLNGGHSIAASLFDFTLGHLFEHPNTWGINWNMEGRGHINWDNYKMTEAWVDLETTPVVNQFPTIKIGSKGIVVQTLQSMLNSLISADLLVDGNFGPKTQRVVMIFQTQNKLKVDGIVGPITWAKLQSLPIPTPQPKSLLNAIIQVESKGDDNAIGDLTLVNHAYGALQIRQGVCDNVNAKFGTTYQAQDCLGNRSTSIDIWNKYWLVYPSIVTNEDKARSWNGGPAWKTVYYLTNKTSGQITYCNNLDIYWSKVQKYL